jgi:hypothetical protein
MHFDSADDVTQERASHLVQDSSQGREQEQEPVEGSIRLSFISSAFYSSPVVDPYSGEKLKRGVNPSMTYSCHAVGTKPVTCFVALGMKEAMSTGSATSAHLQMLPALDLH